MKTNSYQIRNLIFTILVSEGTRVTYANSNIDEYTTTCMMKKKDSQGGKPGV